MIPMFMVVLWGSIIDGETAEVCDCKEQWKLRVSVMSYRERDGIAISVYWAASFKGLNK